MFFFLIQEYWRGAIRISAKELFFQAGLFTLFTLQFPEWMYSFFFPPICPDFALSLNACSFNTTPLLQLCFMRCDSEVWLARRRAGLERKASHSGRSAAGVREDLNSLHPPTPPRHHPSPLYSLLVYRNCLCSAELALKCTVGRGETACLYC